MICAIYMQDVNICFIIIMNMYKYAGIIWLQALQCITLSILLNVILYVKNDLFYIEFESKFPFKRNDS